jgi:glucose/arabinose dehydrogenase
MLVTGRSGRMHVIRKGVLDPTPLSGLPAIQCDSPTALGGLLDVSLHPKFAENRLVYFAYSKPGNKSAESPAIPSTTAVARGRWDGGSALTDVKDIFVADAWAGGPAAPNPACGRGGNADDAIAITKGCSVGPSSGSYGTRLAWDKAGLLYVSLGDRNIPMKSQEPGTHIGKILRIRDDGSVPPDNPFVGVAGWKPEIYSYGHRNPLGLWYRESTGELWSTEEGPQGGDELNLIKAGRNYGWPLAGLGRNYDGSTIGQGFSGPNIEDPAVFWVPAIAISGLSIYDGDKFPQWRGQAFVGAMRNGTGQFVGRVTFNAKGQATGRDHTMLADLRQRIREVKPVLMDLSTCLPTRARAAAPGPLLRPAARAAQCSGLSPWHRLQHPQEHRPQSRDTKARRDPPSPGLRRTGRRPRRRKGTPPRGVFVCTE